MVYQPDVYQLAIQQLVEESEKINSAILVLRALVDPRSKPAGERKRRRIRVEGRAVNGKDNPTHERKPRAKRGTASGGPGDLSVFDSSKEPEAALCSFCHTPAKKLKACDTCGKMLCTKKCLRGRATTCQECKRLGS